MPHIDELFYSAKKSQSISKNAKEADRKNARNLTSNLVFFRDHITGIKGVGDIVASTRIIVTTRQFSVAK